MCKNEAIAFLVAYSYHFFPIKCERRKAKACNSRSISSGWLFIAFNNKKLVQLTPKFNNNTRVSGVAYLWLLKVKNAFETLLNNWLKNLNMAINK